MKQWKNYSFRLLHLIQLMPEFSINGFGEKVCFGFVDFLKIYFVFSCLESRSSVEIQYHLPQWIIDDQLSNRGSKCIADDKMNSTKTLSNCCLQSLWTTIHLNKKKKTKRKEGVEKEEKNENKTKNKHQQKNMECNETTHFVNSNAFPCDLGQFSSGWVVVIFREMSASFFYDCAFFSPQTFISRNGTTNDRTKKNCLTHILPANDVPPWNVFGFFVFMWCTKRSKCTFLPECVVNVRLPQSASLLKLYDDLKENPFVLHE